MNICDLSLSNVPTLSSRHRLFCLNLVDETYILASVLYPILNSIKMMYTQLSMKRTLG